MTFLNPLALLGLLALAVPILVHLFGRRVARRQRFPSLRLLLVASPTPSTRSQPSDLLLLVVRCAIIAAAALALAQPRWSRQDRDRSAPQPSRVVIVDTSASMQRLTSDGATALVRAREMARALVDSSREGLVVETGHPGPEVSGAASWLEQRAGSRELVIISDFQSGTLSEGNLAMVPRGIGIRISRIAVQSLPELADSSQSVTVALTPAATEATWTPVASDTTSSSLTVLAPDDTVARASIAAARQVSSDGPGRHSVTVLFPGYAATAEVASRIGPFRRAWQGDLLLALRRQDLLRTTNAAALRPCAHREAVSLPNAKGQVVATMAGGPDRSPFELVVFSCLDAGTAAGTALLAAINLAATPDAELEELEPVVLPDEILRQWERPATEVVPRGRDDTSPDGRWFWVLVLMLLFAEEWLRRRAPKRVATPAIERRERVA